MKLFKSKKAVAVAATAGLILGIGGGAFAYFTTTGAGTGDATVGTNTALVLHQDTITYSNGVNLLPGTSADVTFTVDNPSSGNQQLGTISVTSVTTDASHTNCNSTLHPTWFNISDTDVVNANYAPGNGQAVAGNLTVSFVNATDTVPGDGVGNQDVCKNATLTFHYTSN